jgi:putative hydrolase of the HAD superfamily
MIKAVFFDFDGVLTPDKTGSYTICKYISGLTGIDIDSISCAYKKTISICFTGKPHMKEYGATFVENSNPSSTSDCFTTRMPVVGIAEKLKTNYKTGIITDNKKDRMTVIIRKHSFEEIFDSIIISADIGTGKDDEKIFHAAAKSLEVEYDECVFIDNQEKNLIVPDGLGMKTIFYDQERNDAGELFGRLKDLKIYF